MSASCRLRAWRSCMSVSDVGDFLAIRSPDHPIIRSPDHWITRSPDHQITRCPHPPIFFPAPSSVFLRVLCGKGFWFSDPQSFSQRLPLCSFVSSVVKGFGFTFPITAIPPITSCPITRSPDHPITRSLCPPRPSRTIHPSPGGSLEISGHESSLTRNPDRCARQRPAGKPSA